MRLPWWNWCGSECVSGHTLAEADTARGVWYLEALWHTLVRAHHKLDVVGFTEGLGDIWPKEAACASV